MSGVVAEKTEQRRDLYNRVGFGRRGDRDVERGHRARRPPHGRHPRRVRRRPSPLRAVLDAAHHDTFTAAQLRRRFDHFYVEHAEIIPAATAALLRGDVGGFALRPTRRVATGRGIAGQPGAGDHCAGGTGDGAGRDGRVGVRGGLRRQRLGARAPGGADALLAAWQARYAEAFPATRATFSSPGRERQPIACS
ncbi:MAG: hypothetical protein R3A10_05990 [Caldilineaceae bacterium]